MRLSTRGKYGLYAMAFLASHAGEGPQTLKTISQAGVPVKYLEQLLGSLRRAGLVRAERGAHGGYALARPPKEISLRHVIDAAEGPVKFSECTQGGTCERAGICKLRPVWQRVTDKINAELESISLLDIIEEPTGGTQA